MITELSFKHFKSWADTGTIRMGPLVGLFGTNSSGKTSLLQFLLMLKQTTESPDRNLVLNLGDERSLVELGTYQEILFAHELEHSLEWSIDWDLPKPITVNDFAKKQGILFRSSRLGYAAEVHWNANKNAGRGYAIKRMNYRFAEAEFGMRATTDDMPDQFELLSNHPSFSFQRERGRPWALPPPVKCYGFPDRVRASYQNASFLSDFELEFEQLFSRLFYLGPLRDYPKRQYPWSGTRPSDMGRRGERVAEALLASREAGVTYSLGQGRKRQTLEERIAHWLRELGLVHSFEIRPITQDSKLFQVWLRRHPNSAEVLITDVGFGVSQILPVITLCYYVPEGSTLLLEQPEIHLHPSVQAGLADVFIETIRRRRIQIILESHSEHLLRRLQRRIAEEHFPSNEAALYFCAIEDGRSRLIPLDLDMFGNITNWPEGFFGDEFGEMAAMQTAIYQRKKAHSS